MEAEESSVGEKEMLSELLASGRLTEDQQDAFADMHEKLDNGVYDSLTKKQRQYVKGVHEKLGLDPGVRNLISTGQVKVTAQEKASLQSFLGSLGPLPKKPPGRK